MTRLLSVVFSLSIVVSASVTTAAVVDAGIAADEVRRVAIDPEHTVRVEGFRLKAGPATVTLVDGFLVPATKVSGRAVEFVFLGEGRIELEPPDEVEAGQLELFTGAEVLSESFDRAVFVVALDTASDAVARKAAAPVATVPDEAGRLFASWLESPERKLLDVESRIFADAVGDPLAAGFFCGYFHGLELGRFLYVVDPLAYEQVTLGQFVQVDLSKRDEKKARRSIEKAQHEGKLIGLEIADLGIWDTWVSTSFRGNDGRPAPGSRGVEPDDYEIDAALLGKGLELAATVRISLRVVVDGLRAVTFEVNPDLTPETVIDGRGRVLEWFRSQNELVAVLAEPAAVGDELEISLGYTGRTIDKVANGTWVQRDTTGWYPHTGIIDRATYTVTLRWPEKLDLVAPGDLEARGADEDGREWRRWRLDRPSIGFSFEVGRYQTVVGRAGDVIIDVAVDRTGRRADRELPEEILATVIDVLDYYSGIFGPYPLDRLQVVSSPRGFSQGLLGFVSLSTAAVLDWEIWGALLGIEDRRTVIAHELAHQWWGNLVGWRSYRDQWISEATASYAAVLWARNRLDAAGDDRLGWGPTANWQTELLRTTDDGRPIESLGPLVIGTRLNSSISSNAYPAIVYKKGAVVLDMLSMIFPEEAFEEILGRIVEVASDRIVATDDFLLAIERLSGADLSWFKSRYVYGTGLPEVYYTSTFEELDDGRWAVAGVIEQQAPFRHRCRVVETAAGKLDVRRNAEIGIDISSSVLAVPFQIGIAGPAGGGEEGRRMLSGRVLVSGESSSFRFEIGFEPEVLWLDRDGRVFGRFFAADRWPKRISYYRALDQEAAGDPAGARDAFRQALGAAVAVVPPGWEDSFRDIDVESERQSLDARIRLGLARLDLDAGKLADARRELELARDLVKSRDRWLLAEDLLVVESRLDLLSGDPRSAFKRLEKKVLGRRGVDSPETWTLLVVAAYEVGDLETLALAAERAEALGVDLGRLERSARGES
jgi:hypothetical protein